MKSKNWLIGFSVFVCSLIGIESYLMIKVDPFFHYHKPLTENYYYELNNQRSQNDGICRNFDYDALITGTSMTENFKTSELDDLFGTNSIKVSFSGGTFRETDLMVKRAIKYNANLQMVVRGIDTDYLFDAPMRMRNDLGEYPSYLYDNNPFNDVRYVLNNDIMADRVIPMISEGKHNLMELGITSFDKYSNWNHEYTFGVDTVFPDGFVVINQDGFEHLSEEGKDAIKANIEINLIEVATDNPDIEFYYFFTPYSIAYWGEQYNSGMTVWQIEAEKYATELMLDKENIHLFMFDDRMDIISDLNNYKDDRHYGEWINSYILKCFKDGDGLLTKENYVSKYDNTLSNLLEYDYNSINEQEDYADDYYVAQKWEMK